MKDNAPEELELPHNIEAEQQFLGALLGNNDLLDQVEHIINISSFYDPVHARIFERIATCVREGRLASPVTMATEFSADEGLKELGGVGYLARLRGAAVASSQIGDYAEMIADLAIRRGVITAAQEAQERAAKGGGASGVEVAQTLEVRAAQLSTQARAKELTASHLAGLTEALAEVKAAREGDGNAVPTGLSGLDARLGGGLRAGQMAVLAGRPGMAKTTVAQNIAASAARAGRGVFFASLEMPRAELALRFVSKGLAERGIEIPYARMRAGRLDDDELLHVTEEMKAQHFLPIITAERAVRTVERMRSAARRAQRQLADTSCPLGLIVIDYVQLVHVDRARDIRERVTAASDACKSLALDLGVPVLALAQLNRQVESRDPPIPGLSDLRESGRLEEDADVVILLYRAERYIARDLEAAQRQAAATDRLADLHADLARARGRLDLVVAKQRSGEEGTERAFLRPDLCHVSDEPLEAQDTMQEGML